MDYFIVFDWMREKLKLNGNDLLIYAYVYANSQSEGHMFTGTIKEIQEAVGCTYGTVITSMKTLENAGLMSRDKAFIGNRMVNTWSVKRRNV